MLHLVVVNSIGWRFPPPGRTMKVLVKKERKYARDKQYNVQAIR